MTEKSRAVDKKLQVNNYLDLLPCFAFDYKGQQLLKNFQLDDILEQELAWNQSYRQSELSGNSDLYKEHSYKLHYITNKEYNKFLVNACSAKVNIGQFLNCICILLCK